MKRSSSKKEYINVYRIEKRGRGPFQDDRADEFLNYDMPSAYHDGGMPEVVRSFNDEDLYKYRFGCPCPESTKEWVVEPQKLSKLGYKISLYKADKASTISSDIQSMFLKRKAKKVKEWEIVEFMKGEKKTYA